MAAQVSPDDEEALLSLCNIVEEEEEAEAATDLDERVAILSRALRLRCIVLLLCVSFCIVAADASC